MSLAASVPQSVERAIRLHTRHQRRVAAGTAAAMGAAAGLAVFLAAAAVDRFVELPVGLRTGLTVLAVASIALGLILAAVAAFRRSDLAQAAGEIDNVAPGSRDLLRSTLDFLARDPGGPQAVNPFLLDATADAAANLATGLDPVRLHGWRRLPAAVVTLVLAASLTAALWLWPFMQMGLLARRFLNPLGNHPRPSLTHIEVLVPLDQRLHEGSDLPVAVSLAGRVPADASCTLHVRSGAGRPQVVLMTPRPGHRFESTLRSLDARTEFFVTAGDGRSAIYRVAVDPRPRMVKLTARYSYPGYTRLPALEEPVRFGELRGVEGTRVRLEFESSLPVDESAVVFPDHKLKIHWDRTRTRGAFEIRLDRDIAFNVRLVAAGGVENRDPALRVRLIPDNPPSVSLLNVPETPVFYRDDVLHLGYRGVDDLGIAEVFVRSSRPNSAGIGAPASREVSVNLTQASSREVNGELDLELRELVDDEAEGVDIQLIMVDTKGQEAASPRLQISLVSDTPERQLAELCELQDKFRTSLGTLAAGLRAQAGRLGVLVEGMDDATKIEGKRAEMLDGVLRDLAPLGVPDVAGDLGQMRFFAISEYPEPVQRWSEICFSDALLIKRGSSFAQALRDARAGASPRPALMAAAAAMERHAAAAQGLDTALAGVGLDTRLQWLAGMAEQFIEAEERLLAAGAAGDAQRLARQRQDQRLAQIQAGAQATAARPEAQTPELAAVRDALAGLAAAAAAAQTRPGEAGVLESVRKLALALKTGPAFDGSLGASLVQLQAQAPLAKRALDAFDAGDVGAARLALASRLRLRRDDLQAGPAETLVLARLCQAALTGDRGRLAAAAAWAQAAEPWVRASDAYHRLMTLRHRLRAWSIDAAVGRLPTKGVKLDQSWQPLREWALSIMRDHRAGAFTGLDAAVSADLAKLTTWSDLFSPWLGAQAARQPGFDRRLGELSAALDAAIARLAPQVEAGSAGASAQVAELMRDLAAVLAAERPLMQAERQALAQEVAAASRVDPSREKRVRGQMANPARLGYSASLGSRLACHAAALAAALDAREEAWSRTPDPAAAAELAAATILFEYFAHLEEDFYDKAIGPHLEQVYGNRPYPGFVEAIGVYYDGLMPLLDQTGVWAGQIAAGQSLELGKAEAFTQLLSRVNKMARFNESQRSLRQHGEFLAALPQVTDPARRRAMFGAMAADLDQSSAFWERIVFGIASLGTQAEAATSAGASWTGLPAPVRAQWVAAGNGLRGMLPEARPASEEVKLVDDLLAALPPLVERVAAERWAGLAAGERDGLRDDLDRWRGEALAAMRALESKTSVPTPTPRPRARFVGRPRADLGNVQGRILRGEARWVRRAAAAARASWVARAGALLPWIDPASERRDVCWVFAQEGATRRKSAAALSQRSRALGLDAGGPDAQYLKLPRHLYDELQRASARPYPEQFKEPALRYMDGLLKDSR